MIYGQPINYDQKIIKLELSINSKKNGMKYLFLIFQLPFILRMLAQNVLKMTKRNRVLLDIKKLKKISSKGIYFTFNYIHSLKRNFRFIQ